MYQIQTLHSVDPAVSNYNTDILEFPELGRNQLIKANSYGFFRFCVPICSNVKIVLNEYVNRTAYQQPYTSPELLVSREIFQPTLKDYRYHLKDTKL